MVKELHKRGYRLARLALFVVVFAGVNGVVCSCFWAQPTLFPSAAVPKDKPFTLQPRDDTSPKQPQAKRYMLYQGDQNMRDGVP